jgi:hypothetical protein
MRRKSPPKPRQIPLFLPTSHERLVALAAPQQRELIRALAELLLRAAAERSAGQGAHDGR